MNVNDLMLYKALGAMVNQTKKHTLLDIDRAVMKAWRQLDPKTITKAWSVLFQNYFEVLKAHGGNDFKYPHTQLRQRLNGGFGAGIESPALFVEVPADLKDECEELTTKYKDWIEEYNAGRANLGVFHWETDDDWVDVDDIALVHDDNSESESDESVSESDESESERDTDASESDEVDSEVELPTEEEEADF